MLEYPLLLRTDLVASHPVMAAMGCKASNPQHRMLRVPKILWKADRIPRLH